MKAYVVWRMRGKVILVDFAMTKVYLRKAWKTMLDRTVNKHTYCTKVKQFDGRRSCQSRRGKMTPASESKWFSRKRHHLQTLVLKFRKCRLWCPTPRFRFVCARNAYWPCDGTFMCVQRSQIWMSRNDDALWTPALCPFSYMLSFDISRRRGLV